MKSSKIKSKASKAAHTPSSPKGMGDFYGSGTRNPVGKIRSGPGMVSKKQSKVKPSSLA